MDVKVEQRRDRRNRRELDARKGKEGESEREAAEIRARRGNEKIPGSREAATRWEELERTGRKERERRGRKRRETRRQRGRGDPWRSLYRTVERNGESQDGKRRTRRGGRLPWRESMRCGENWRELERTGRKEGEGRKAKGEETSRQRDPSGPGDVYPGDPGP